MSYNPSSSSSTSGGVRSNRSTAGPPSSTVVPWRACAAAGRARAACARSALERLLRAGWSHSPTAGLRPPTPSPTCTILLLRRRPQLLHHRRKLLLGTHIPPPRKKVGRERDRGRREEGAREKREQNGSVPRISRGGTNPHLEGIFSRSRSAPAAPHPNSRGSRLASLRSYRFPTKRKCRRTESQGRGARLGGHKRL
jgi:hypothetical protein